MFKDSQGAIMYIGKAKDLRKRVSSYFVKNDHTPKTQRLVDQIHSAEYFITNTEMESYLLESQLIKEHQPKYNVMLKSGVHHAWLKVSIEEEFPRLLEVRRLTKDGKYFGPYVDADARKKTVRAVRKIFKIRTCKTLPKKECLYFHIGLCSAPCIGAISKEEYQQNIRNAMEVLKGNVETVSAQMEVEMKEAAKQMQYEKAKTLRDQLAALQRLPQKQQVEKHRTKNQDIIAWVSNATHTQITLLHIVKGVIRGKENARFENLDLSPAEEFITRYYETHTIPDEIVLQEELETQQGLFQFLCSLKQGHVDLHVPQRGDSLRLVELAKENAAFALHSKTHSPAVIDLQTALKLPSPPNRIECFDISTLQGTNTVASMVAFEDGKPVKANYRHFHVKTVPQQDDFASMKEVVGRRYKRLLEEEKPMPDLIVIDGGEQQLRFAYEAVSSLGLHLPIIGLAKKEEDIYTIGSRFPLKLDHKRLGLKLLQRIRDEAHRFAITFHRKTRGKQMLHSILDDIVGLGPKKKSALLKKFGDIETIKTATFQELEKILGKKTAEELLRAL